MNGWKNSGLVEAPVQALVAFHGMANVFVKASQVNRSRHAYQSSLHIAGLLEKAYIQYGVAPCDQPASFEDLCALQK